MLTANIKLSIIIPTLDEERFLPFLLSSIKNQDFSDLEVIVADAGSTDKTLAIAKQFGCQITPGGMPAVGRNHGAQLAQGEWLLFLDADVILPKNFLQELFGETNKKNLDAASCAIVPLSDKNIDLILHGLANAYIFATQYFYPHAPGFCILIKKSLHYQITGFNEKLKLAEDHDYIKRAKKNGRFGILKKPKIFVSVRRLETDGRLNISTKYFLCEAYRLLLGEIESDIFKYKFGRHLNGFKNGLKEKTKKLWQ